MIDNRARADRGPIYDSAEAADPLDDELRAAFGFRDFILIWTRRNISLRYKRSLLGVLWTVLEP